MTSFETVYTRKRIGVLTTVQMHQFHWKRALAVFLAGFLIAVLSLMYIEKSEWLALPLALGCWMCVSAWYPAQYFAKKIWKGMGEKEQTYSYRFGDKEIEIRQGTAKNTVPYNRIALMAQSGSELCIFLNQDAGFVVSMEELTQEQQDNFLKKLRKNTGQAVHKDQGLVARLLKRVFRGDQGMVL